MSYICVVIERDPFNIVNLYSVPVGPAIYVSVMPLSFLFNN